MPVTVNSIESGITSAVMSAAREVAEQQEQDDDHEQRALDRFVATVAIVRVDELRAVVDGRARRRRPAACG